jgi:hypothetical protein
MHDQAGSPNQVWFGWNADVNPRRLFGDQLLEMTG